MRKLVLSIIALFSLTVFLGASSPSHVSATATHHAPHLFRKPSQHGSAALNANNVSYHGGRVVDGTMNVYTIFGSRQTMSRPAITPSSIVTLPM